jgi:enoyl-CoA hydratase
MAGESATTPEVLFDRPRPGVLQITLNRPERRNAFSNNCWQLIANALREAETDDGMRCVVVTGGPKDFAAGSDINEMKARGMFGDIADTRFRNWDTIHRFAKPMIAAVNGYALGGGCELAMACDIVIAGRSAQFGLPEVNLGLIPGLGGTQRLVRAVGKSMAMKLILSGEFIGVDTALSLGLVAEVTEDGETISRALNLAEVIAGKAPLAVRAAKLAVLQGYESSLEAGLAYERKATVLLFASEDMKEGVDAFLGKRKPKFKGR